MTKIYTALALLAAIIGLGAAEYREAVAAASDLLETVEAADDAAKRGDGELIELSQKTAASWEEHKRTLELFLPHGELDLTDLAAEQLIVYAECGDYKNARIALTEIANSAHALHDNEIITIYNLM